MIFEMEVKNKKEVLSIDTSSITNIKYIVGDGVAKINSFIDEFNLAHLGMPISFNAKYTKALIEGRLSEVAGTDFAKYLSESPKFLHEQLNRAYKNFIEPLYYKGSHLENTWGKMCYSVYERANIPSLINLLSIKEDGRISITYEFEEAVTNNFTVYTTDINPLFAEKMEQYIKLENELKLLVGKHNFANVMSSQCPIEFNNVYHEFNLGNLIKYIKKYNHNTYKTNEQG